MYLSRKSVESIEGKLLHRTVRASEDSPPNRYGTVIGVQWFGLPTSGSGDGGVHGEALNGCRFRPIVLMLNGTIEHWSEWQIVPWRHDPVEPTLIDDVLTDGITMERFAELVGCTMEQATALITEVGNAREMAMRAPETTAKS